MSAEYPARENVAHRSAPSTQHWLGTAALILALISFALNLWRYGGYLLDDTFISFRYAQNLITGHGLVFNPGERVEGYTNFLFVLAAAVCLRLGIDPVAGTKAISLASAALLAISLVRLGREHARLWLPLAFLLPLPGFAYWAAASFETMPFTCAAVVALLLQQRERESGRFHGAVLAFVVLALIRPEGVMLFVLGTVMNGLVAGLQRRPFLRRATLNAMLFAIAYGAYFAWRFHYYGDLFPNTFRAKVTGGWEQALTGLRYLGTWSRTYPVMAMVLVLPLAYLLPRVRQQMRMAPSIVVMYGVALGYAAYVTLVGGDFMPFHRFFVPLLPLTALLIGVALTAMPSPWQRRLVLLLFPLHIACGYWTEEPYRAFVAHRTAVVGHRVGERLAQELAPDDLIAVNTAGALPYFSQRPAVDMLGLTDATIAQRPVFIVSPGWAGHRRGWGAYVLNRQPRVIFFYNASGSREPFYLSDRELADDPYFRFFYQERVFSIPAPTATDKAVARFLGFPFGFDASGQAPWRDLGLHSRFVRSPLSHTELYESETVAHYFLFSARDADLWAARQPDNVDAFLDTVVRAWSAVSQPGADPVAREQVHALCEAAREKIEHGETAAAKSLLTRAAQQNIQARSPLVYQYIANVAVLDGDLFTAIGAQKEALRLSPENDLYRRNLHNLLQRPYKPREAS